MAHNSSKFKKAAFASDTKADSAETTYELTYSDNINKWLTIQPDVQYIINPGADNSVDNAFVVGSRFTIKF